MCGLFGLDEDALASSSFFGFFHGNTFFSMAPPVQFWMQVFICLAVNGVSDVEGQPVAKLKCSFQEHVV
jgi:hypothetical protein